MPLVPFTPLQDSGRGFVTYGRAPDGYTQHGDLRALTKFYWLAKRWFDLYPNRPIQVGDISLPHGQPFPPHKGHRNGRQFDIRPWRLDGKRLPIYYNLPQYDSLATLAFLQRLRDQGNTKHVFFNCPIAIDMRLSQYVIGHDNHIHVEFAE